MTGLLDYNAHQQPLPQQTESAGHWSAGPGFWCLGAGEPGKDKGNCGRQRNGRVKWMMVGGKFKI